MIASVAALAVSLVALDTAVRGARRWERERSALRRYRLLGTWAFKLQRDRTLRSVAAPSSDEGAKREPV